ncbi:MAG TPA: hypothetical protein VFS56_07310 [Gemmatimonadaceae bacterium]|nr:hypothetical protein [Gemmatimonadaceae bacterium]
MQNKNGKQKGPQDHAEGQHGSKTRRKILEQLHSGNGGVQRRPRNNGTDPTGAHRLGEDRQQRDRGEKKSEKTRLNRDVERGKVPRPHIDSETT